MTIYTKKGDSGETSLVGGERVLKSSPRVNAYGDMDELISILGLLRCEIPSMEKEIRSIQEVLMNGSAHVATGSDSLRLKEFPAESTSELEAAIDMMTSKMPQQRSFILPSSPKSSSLCHFARTVCRRSERSVVALNDHRPNIERVSQYLNRLSDYLFTLGRYMCHVENIPEDFWLV